MELLVGSDIRDIGSRRPSVQLYMSVLPRQRAGRQETGRLQAGSRRTVVHHRATDKVGEGAA